MSNVLSEISGHIKYAHRFLLVGVEYHIIRYSMVPLKGIDR